MGKPKRALTEKQMEEVRKAHHQDGETQVSIARRLGVSYATINRVITGYFDNSTIRHYADRNIDLSNAIFAAGEPCTKTGSLMGDPSSERLAMIREGRY